jgi:predicted nucleotidyltransferase component of viral defense system
MTNQVYKKQAALLLEVLPEIARETCFAMHGGTAINLFVQDMHRISVDIDLTYVPIEDRQTTLKNISEALERIQARILKMIPSAQVIHKKEVGKLLISAYRTDIKLEANLVKRGLLSPSQIIPLCKTAQDEFQVFCTMPIIPIGQLYGGKICAALDRQHPRNLFDVKCLLENEGFTEEIKTGFLFGLVSGGRPILELINPNLQDQRLAMANQFDGMSDKAFSYPEFERVRTELITTIQQSFTDTDKEFLISIKSLEPKWEIYNFEQFPAVQWKLQNLAKLREANSKKYQDQLEALKAHL